MVAAVPTFTAATYLTDPQSIIGYQINLFERMPKDTMPVLDDLIISLPFLVAKFGQEPDILRPNIEQALQGVFSRIFSTERQVLVSVSYTYDDTTNLYTYLITVTYTLESGEIDQYGSRIYLTSEGRLHIPESTVGANTLSSLYP